LNKLIFILLFIYPFKFFGDYPLKDGKPTSKGIEQYIDQMSDSLVVEYQNFVGDTLYDVWIYAEDFPVYDILDSMELGRYYPDEIYISTQELFLAYELADLPKRERILIVESNKFVKAAVIHELTHDYVHQISVEMRSIDSIHVDRSYQSSLRILRSYDLFGSTFIEEGICEYIVEKMGELISPKRPFIPRTIKGLTDKNNRYHVNYKYSSYYLKTFLDTTGFKKGVKVLLHNSPPSYEEILKPDLFFSRLVLINY